MRATQQIEEKRIEMTEDYEIFKVMHGNRVVDEAHVQKLMRAMRVNDLFTPIMVNNQMEVVDGQHRLEARKRLKLIVPYFSIGDYGLSEVQAINAQQKKWSNLDYTESYISLGKKDYEIYKWFRREFEFPHVVTVSLLMGLGVQNTAASTIFKDGEFKVKQLEYAKNIGLKIRELKPFTEFYNDRSFIVALATLLNKEVFDFTKFVEKLKANAGMFKKCANIKQYTDLIEEIYNYRSQNKVSLKYSE